MKLTQSRLLVITSMLVGGATLPAHAESVNNANNNTANIDQVITELTRQHDNSSSLVKNARQPTSLALNSTLISQSKTQAKTKDASVLGQLTAVASNTVTKFKQTGVASWYGRQFHGSKTATGETFDMNAMTAAHPTLPLNCYIRVTNKDNGKSVVVRVNDRGSFSSGNRVLDLSYGAAKVIGITQKGTGNVTIERIDNP